MKDRDLSNVGQTKNLGSRKGKGVTQILDAEAFRKEGIGWESTEQKGRRGTRTRRPAGTLVFTGEQNGRGSTALLGSLCLPSRSQSCQRDPSHTWIMPLSISLRLRSEMPQHKPSVTWSCYLSSPDPRLLLRAPIVPTISVFHTLPGHFWPPDSKYLSLYLDLLIYRWVS